jgi:hypothetical protein
MPAAIICSSTSGSFDAGPIVATIFVERMTPDLTHEKPALSDRRPKPVVDAQAESGFDGPRP